MSQGPVEALRGPRLRWRAIAAAAAAVAVVTVGGIGAYALNSVAGGANLAQASPTPTPTPTSEPSNLEPTASYELTVADGLTLTFDAAASTDPEDAIASYTWDFGDGATGEGVTTSHTYATEGTYTVTLTVTDDAGQEATTAAAVTAAAPPPPPPPAPSGPVRCPAGSTANSNDGVNDTSCYPNVCFSITVPDPNHPECDASFRP